MLNDTSISAFLTEIGMNNAQAMNIDYYFNRSGYKTISTLLENFISGEGIIVEDLAVDDNGNYVTDSEGNLITLEYFTKNINTFIVNNIIRIKYLPIWKRIYETFITEFEAINPYSQEITETSNDKLDSEGTSQNSGTTSSEFTNTDTRKDDSTTTDTEDKSNNSTRSVSGYDSSTMIPSESDSGTEDNTRNSTYSDEYSATNSGTNEGSSSNNGSTTYNSERDITRSVSRKGNIGNRSYTELLRDAMEYYKFNIFDRIYDDLDEILTRPAYN